MSALAHPWGPRAAATVGAAEPASTARRWAARAWTVTQAVAITVYVTVALLILGIWYVVVSFAVGAWMGGLVGSPTERLVNKALPAYMQLCGQLTLGIMVVTSVGLLAYPVVAPLVGTIRRRRKRRRESEVTTPVYQLEQPRPVLEDARPVPRVNPASVRYGQGTTAVPVPEPVARAEPKIGYRYWDLHAVGSPGGGSVRPVLASLWREYQWQERDLTAECYLEPYRTNHQAPSADCECGIYALKDEDGGPAIGTPPVMAAARVALYGRVFEGTSGYRAERARIMGPLTVAYRCGAFSHKGCERPPVVVITDEGVYHPLCETHAVGPGPAMTVDEFEWHLRMELELRYGVSVEIGADSGYRRDREGMGDPSPAFTRG